MADAVIDSIKQKFDEFLDSYYAEQINELIVGFPDKRSLLVDVKDLEGFDPDMASELLTRPDMLIEAAGESLKSKMTAESDGHELHVRFFGQNINNPLIQDVGSKYIGKLINLDSLIVKRSEIIPKVKIGAYKCTFCGATYKLRVDHDAVPEICVQCKRKSLKQESEGSQFVNIQKIAVQDPLEKLRGNTPTWQLEVWIEDDLINTVIPGDRIELTGVLHIRPRRSSHGKSETNMYSMFLDTVSIISKQKDFADIYISEEDERQILELSKDPQIFDKITKSVVPSVYGMDEIKQAIVLELFGGTEGKQLVDGGKIRSDIHMLLIGDPGSAKTRVLQAVTKLVPKGIYVSGKSITGGGMTAVAERDEFSEGGWTLKAGALVLGSGGIVAIDEFDKIGDSDRSSLHEALESQTISVAKAGIIATFNAKAAVLAAANPKRGRFDPNQYPADQFDIPPTLLSRFDLIFPVRDIMDEELDKSIAKHILTQHEAAGAKIAQVQEYEQVEKPQIESELLRKYIAYSKKTTSPRLGDAAASRIQDYYVELRKTGMRQGTTPITPRQIEGLVRLAEASAKTRLSSMVESADVERAISLNEFMFKTLLTDRRGVRDIDVIMTNMPREKVDKMNLVLGLIKSLEEKEAQEGRYMGAKIQTVKEEAEKQGMDMNAVDKYIRELERSGDIFSPRPGIVKTVRQESE